MNDILVHVKSRETEIDNITFKPTIKSIIIVELSLEQIQDYLASGENATYSPIDFNELGKTIVDQISKFRTYKE